MWPPTLDLFAFMVEYLTDSFVVTVTCDWLINAQGLWYSSLQCNVSC